MCTEQQVRVSGSPLNRKHLCIPTSGRKNKLCAIPLLVPCGKQYNFPLFQNSSFKLWRKSKSDIGEIHSFLPGSQTKPLIQMFILCSPPGILFLKAATLLVEIMELLTFLNYSVARKYIENIWKISVLLENIRTGVSVSNFEVQGYSYVLFLIKAKIKA